MRSQRVQRIRCLLTDPQLTRYIGLLNTYRQAFGVDRVCWTPIEDFQLADPDMLLIWFTGFMKGNRTLEWHYVITSNRIAH